jgi:hypothetical protein
MHTCISNKYTGGTNALDLEGKPLMQKRYDMYMFDMSTYMLPCCCMSIYVVTLYRTFYIHIYAII